MNTNLIHEIAVLRTLTGYLGESEQYGWWPSNFYAEMSESFLPPVFAKTHALARFSGVSMAAAGVHDERIGIGQVYHLFRLPEYFEASLHRAVQNEGVQRTIARHMVDRKSAMTYLLNRSTSGDKTDVETEGGPIRVGDLDSLMDRAVWARVAAYYVGAFGSDSQVYPFFSDGQ